MKTQTDIKSITRTILFAIAFFTFSFAYANEAALKFQVKKLNNTMLSITIESPNQSELHLELSDNNEQLLWEKKIKNTNSFSKQFDLSNLPDGIYHFEMEDANSISINSLILENSELTISSQRKILKPNFSFKNDKANLSVEIENAEIARIEVTNANGEMVYTESFEGRKNVNKIFDFSEVKNEYFLIRTKIDDKSFYYSVN